MQLSREICPREVIHITSISFVDVIGVLGAVAGIVSLALDLYDRCHKNKK